MINKLIPVTYSSMPPYDEYCAEIQSIWINRRLTNMGEKHQELEGKLKAYLHIPYVDLVTNGHMAIELAIQALELAGEIITTPFTFASTTQAIVRCGLKPVFCDINPIDFTIDVDKLESLITDSTSAILPVHVYGNVCRVNALDRIAKQHNLKIIYDAAHGFGVRYQGMGISEFGDASCFSFHATKVFHTIEGGAVCCRNPTLGEKIARLRNFGLTGQEQVGEIGGNAKMDEFRAAMGLCNLRHMEEETAKRKLAAERYRQRLEGVPGLRLNQIQKDVTPNYAYFPILFAEKQFGAGRDQVMRKLADEGVYARRYFYPLASDFACYKGRFDSRQTPVARKVSKSVLCLPLYAGLAPADVDRICDIILSCKK